MVNSTNTSAAFLGIDVGTSGIRAIVIDQQQTVQASSMQSMPVPEQPQENYFEQHPDIWWQTLQSVLTDLSQQFDLKKINSISLDATSGTVLLINNLGEPVSKGIMYNDQRAIEYVHTIKQHAPENSPTCSATSGLAKALWLLNKQTYPEKMSIAHQADWLMGKLTNRFNQTDSNNALKTGYDPINKEWPEWLTQLGINKNQLPKVSNPGTRLYPLDKKIIQQFDFNEQVQIISGTTDSTAALLATGANKVGDAVTSLGSTLVVKVISDNPIFSSKDGVYSQPYGKHWLVGGASNTGGAVLRRYFTDMQMSQLEKKLNANKPTNLNYYPLLQMGERFPINDPKKTPHLTPKPNDDALFFQALLEGISSIEKACYDKLKQLGAPTPKRLFSVGGGTVNKTWANIRNHYLNIPQHDVLNNHAAFGAALLAKQGYDSQQ